MTEDPIGQSRLFASQGSLDPPVTQSTDLAPRHSDRLSSIRCQMTFPAGDDGAVSSSFIEEVHAIINGSTTTAGTYRIPRDGTSDIRGVTDDLVIFPYLETDALTTLPNGTSHSESIKSKLAILTQGINLDENTLARIEAARDKGDPWTVEFDLLPNTLSHEVVTFPATSEPGCRLDLCVKPSDEAGSKECTRFIDRELKYHFSIVEEPKGKEATEFSNVFFKTGISVRPQLKLWTSEGKEVGVRQPRGDMELYLVASVPSTVLYP